jgi:hypothetical protein
MGPHKSLSEDLPNNYQCHRVSIASKIVIIFLFCDYDLHPERVNEFLQIPQWVENIQ